MLAQIGRFDLPPSARASLTPETEGDIEISQGLNRCAKTSKYILIQGLQTFLALYLSLKISWKKIGKKRIFRKRKGFLTR